MGSMADELRFALLDERGEPLLRVLAREELAERIAFRRQVLFVVAAERPVRQLLHRAERDRALRGQQSRGLARLLEHRIVNRVDEPEPQSLIGADDAPGEDQLLGDAQAAHAGETLSAAPARNDPEIHLWLAKLRGTRRVAKVTRQRQLATTAQSEAVDRRDRRLGH